ncbi:stalk domain-containing protein [Paenibacillus alginolyticus]|uniref:Stalk domain-containing protein n=1 Tax=Paenibacillus alginolyticus TaxID=59839 RepID=A0ABT4GD00_9BACL|nr:stalk domain-containing protein [Paenibacillus alginolyticus]MCY9694061.1 stalk domain-containing protein [Paenibacillus alginolyticus]MEC0143519.1 stalk domain-containing protein [Paenibacillus alginolyticus]
MKGNHKVRWIFNVKIIAIIFVLCSSIFWSAKPSYALSYGTLSYPQGDVGLLRPDIGVTLELSEGKTPESYHFYLNDKELNVSYDPVSVKFVYRPTADLLPGNYSARLVLSFNGYQPITINWKFNVIKGAVSLSSETTKEQEDGLQAINDYRAKLGLSKVKFSSALNTAAQKHAQYLSQNKIDPIRTSVSLHDEDPALPGYIGKSLRERVQFIGYSRSSSEDVAYNRVSLVEAIDSLFDAPYHRSPFMVPGLVEIGVFKDGDYHVIEFGFSDGIAPELVVSPGNNDVYVPTIFDGHETPDPIRLHTGAEYPVGYPIMASLNGPGVKKVSLVEAELKDESGNAVSLLKNEPGKDDHLDTEVIVMPSKPLELDTTYKAKIKLTAIMEDGSTRPYSKEWTFRTESRVGVGVLKLHKDAVAYTLQMANFGLNRNHLVSFGLNEDKYLLDLIPYPMKQKPYIQDGTSYLYIRDLAAALGATVEWDDSQKAAVYKKKDKTIIFYTNRNAYSLNGVEYKTESAAKLIHETTMIPVRLLSETLGAKVTYEESTRTVNISY